jgi:hypothetical protein
MVLVQQHRGMVNSGPLFARKHMQQGMLVQRRDGVASACRTCTWNSIRRITLNPSGSKRSTTLVFFLEILFPLKNVFFCLFFFQSFLF